VRRVTCQYCGGRAVLVDSAEVYGGRSYGMIWLCRPCQAWVGVHRNSPDRAPLGRLANAELRAWKVKAHAAFDPLWKYGRMPRREAYQVMQRILDLTPIQAHIGKLDVDQCQTLVRELAREASLPTCQGQAANRRASTADEGGQEDAS
jgi:hypothetical protein